MRRLADDFKATERTLKESVAAERDAEIRAAENRERERAAREKLDLERRARETMDRFQALLDEGEKRRAAEEEVLRKEARAEILRREALLRKSFEQQRAELEAEKVKAIELETQKLEERLRAEFETERGGFLRGGGEGSGEGAGVDLEAEVWEHLKGHLAGSAEYKLFAGFEESSQPLAERYRHEGVFKLRYDLKFLENFELLLVPRVWIDSGGLSHGAQEKFEDSAEQRPSFTFEEGWVLGAFESFDAKVGKVIVAWGTGDLVNPTDIVNPVDYTDLLDSEKIGVPGTDASYFIGEETRLRLVVVPTFTPSRLPPAGERFNPVPPEGIFLPTPIGPVGPVPVGHRDLPARTFENAQAALRASSTVEGFDLSATYFTGFNDLPVLTIDPTGDPASPIVLTPRFDRIHMFGGDMSTTLGDFELHAEAAQFVTEGDRDDDYLQYVFGTNWSRGDLLIGKDQLTVILEYTGEWVTKDATAENVIPATGFARAFTGAVLGRVTYRPIAGLELQATAALIVDGDENIYVRPEATYEFGSHTKHNVGLDLLSGPRGTFFGQFRDEDRFTVSFKVSF